jgi:hypothetical protein
MSLYVKIFINHAEIRKFSARRLSAFKGDDAVHDYIDQDGQPLTHKYSDGPVVLAQKLLKGSPYE